MVELRPLQLVSVQIFENTHKSAASFSDIIRPAFKPPLKELLFVLARKTPMTTLVIV